MFRPDDTTYKELRGKSLEQWLEDMSCHEDIAVRGGIPLVRDYLKSLEAENKRLQEENELKNRYLKKIKEAK